jgi:phenylpropionate dioxygenase-like ring-hydroxylating dioxygenase large terminal subunit
MGGPDFGISGRAGGDNALRNRTRFPMPPYPTGWYRVLNADELGAGDVRSVRYFGRELAVARLSGAVRVFDAFCPHLGANVAVGGRIEDDAIACPFHGWRFGNDGTCIDIPDGRRVPPGACLRAYPAREVNGVIAAFYDEGRRPPAWEVPAIADYGDSTRWAPRQWKSWHVRTHVQEVSENGPDVLHQRSLHGASQVSDAAVEVNGFVFRGEFQATYDAGGDFAGTPIPQRISYVDVGLGFIHITSHVEHAGIRFRREVQFCMTPIDEVSINVTLSTRMERLDDDRLTEFVDEFSLARVWTSFEQDIPIWENKIYRPVDRDQAFGVAPAKLCDADRDLVKHRRWTRQFYPDTVNAGVRADALPGDTLIETRGV